MPPRRPVAVSGRLAAALLSVPPGRAAAAVGAASDPLYSLLPAQSSLTYTFIQAGGRNQGRFKSFSVSFDPANGRLEVVIDMRSFDTGDSQRDTLLGGRDFFDVAQYPQARFTATRIERTGGGYQAAGTLTLRGVKRDVTVPFTWRTAAAQGRAVGYLVGQMQLRRLDFGVGQGQWRYTQWVGNEVTVGYSLVLTASR